jgi:hypothetical protein
MLWITITGQVSLAGAVENAKKFCDTSADLGLNRILVDCSKLKGGLSTQDRYELGLTAAEYAICKRIAPVLAFVGHLPTIDGFAAMVATNRGLISETFGELDKAIAWLNDNPKGPKARERVRLPTVSSDTQPLPKSQTRQR